MFKDKQKVVILGAIVLLFVVLSSGGFSISVGDIHIFRHRTWLIVLLMALGWWFFCGGSKCCCGSRCGVSQDEDSGEEADDQAADNTDEPSEESKTN